MATGTLTVGVIWHHVDNAENVYIGRSSKRPSPLGNPFIINAHRTRDQACDQYRTLLVKEVKKTGSPMSKEMTRLGKLLLSGVNVNLQCYCKDKRCHGEEIKKVLDKAIMHRNNQKEISNENET